MKSKRKEVNRLKNKPQAEEEQESDQILKRTTGVKPFRLSKIRMQRRQSESILSKKASADFLGQKYPMGKNCSPENQDVYLDLIIKKKLLVDTQKNVKLDSQRKAMVAKDSPEQNQAKDQETLLEIVSTEQACLNNVSQQQLQAFKSEDFSHSQQFKHKRSRIKCECCHQIHGYSRQAIICKANQFDMYAYRSSSARGSNSEASLEKDKIDPKAELRNIIEKTSKSPFSFTNLKWRSKSQSVIVDKWKQKYDHITGLSNSPAKKKTIKLIDYQLSGRKRQSKEKVQKQRVSLPILAKPHQPQKQAKTPQLLAENTKEQLKLQKKQLQIYKQQTKIQKEPTKAIPQIGKIKISSDQADSSKQSNIVIKEMYSKQHLQAMESQQKKAAKQQKDGSKDNLEQVFNMIKQEKHKNKKRKYLRSKFPEITVSTCYSVKENEDGKKKLRLANLQKMAGSKSKPAKKTYFEKQLEQIPQRWEYGESRDQSREEVQQYVSIKKQELAQLQQKRLVELAQFNDEEAKLQLQSIQIMQNILINKD